MACFSEGCGKGDEEEYFKFTTFLSRMNSFTTTRTATSCNSLLVKNNSLLPHK